MTLRHRYPSESNFSSRLRSAAVAARVGVWLGLCFVVAFTTGLISHYAYESDAPVPFPTSPAWGYRVTQGIHYVVGSAAVPLLLVKLWTVYPKLFSLPPLPRSSARLRAFLVDLAEKGSIAVLVAAAIFQLASGLPNATEWYPFSFSFRATHYAIAWVAMGSLVVHVAVKLPVIRDVLLADVDDTVHDRPTANRPSSLSRRGLLRATWLATGVAALSVAGNSVGWLRDVSIFAVRSGDGPAGLPITTSAAEAGVTAAATDPDYRLVLSYGGRSRAFTREDLLALPRTTSELPIACVEGWSKQATWTGVRLRDLLDTVSSPRGRAIHLESVQPSGPFRTSVLPAQFVDDHRTLLALELNGEPLGVDHGYPARVIAPNRPGVLQTKWVGKITVL